MIFAKLKIWLITIATFALTILTLGAYAKHQKRRADNASKKDEQQTELINDAKQHQKNINDSYQLDDDAINNELFKDFRD